MINVVRPAAKLRIQRRLVRLAQAVEKGMSRELAAVLNEQCGEAADVVEHGHGGHLDALLDQWRPDLVRAFWAAFRRTGTVFYQQVADAVQQLKTTRPVERKGMGDEFWNNFQAFVNLHTASKVTRVNDTTKRWIKRVINRGTSEGKAPREIAKELRASGQFNKMRANRIARTEVHMVSNFATQQAVKSTHLRMEKEWVAFIDDRTRPEAGADPKWDHRVMNGKRVGMNEDFLVSGERMAYPGDNRGSAANVINCRCVLLYHTVRGR